MSAGSTHTAQILRDIMPGATVIAPDLPIHPEEAMDQGVAEGVQGSCSMATTSSPRTSPTTALAQA